MRGLEVGESFVVSTHEGYTAVRARWTDLRPKRFAMRKTGSEGWRVWRLE
jgi:phage portal protein BeeE